MLELFLGIGIGFCVGFWYCKTYQPQGSSNQVQTSSNELPQTSSYADSGEYKMVLVVRQDLGMGKGKAAAQCCHAAVDVVRRAKKNHPQWLSTWENIGCAKVCVKCPDEETLIALSNHARILGLDAVVISDAGRTQIASGSKTVLGIGPAPVDLLDKVTGHLKLF